MTLRSVGRLAECPEEPGYPSGEDLEGWGIVSRSQYLLLASGLSSFELLFHIWLRWGPK